MKFNLSKVSCKYGSPLGRHSDNPANFEGLKVHLEKVRIDSGGYDSGGAYWGTGLPLYVAWSEDESGVSRMFIRASNRNDAKNKLPEGIKFYV